MFTRGYVEALMPGLKSAAGPGRCGYVFAIEPKEREGAVRPREHELAREHLDASGYVGNLGALSSSFRTLWDVCARRQWNLSHEHPHAATQASTSSRLRARVRQKWANRSFTLLQMRLYRQEPMPPSVRPRALSIS